MEIIPAITSQDSMMACISLIEAMAMGASTMTVHPVSIHCTSSLLPDQMDFIIARGRVRILLAITSQKSLSAIMSEAHVSFVAI